MTDIIFLHAPSVYDFRKLSIMYGPVADLIPSAPVFEMYPVGLSTLSAYLERSGYKTRIINIAVRMLRDPQFDAERLIKNLYPKAFGIDLHWLPHAHGSIEIAKIVKKYHPKTPVIFGGFSSTYFHRGLITYPCVDFVLRGDSTEEPLKMLIATIKRGDDPIDVPNLTWKDKEGNIRENPLTYVPENINHLVLDYSQVMKSVVRYRDLVGTLPFKDWLKNPVTAALTCKGCTKNCTFCGGSAFTSKNFYGRDKIAYRDPELVADDIRQIQGNLKSPTFVLGDLCQDGKEYADRFFKAVKKLNITNQVGLEFFSPPDEDFFKKAHQALPHYSMGASLESHDLKVRKGSGKTYTNKEVEASIGWALKNGVERFEIYYMTGLSYQTRESVLETVDYCEHLYDKFKGDKRVLMFISPMTPFLDPGSLIYENPEKYGYTIRCKTLEEHRQALLQPSWKYVLNYETKWMTRDEQVKSTYEAMLGINKVKAKYKVIDEKEAERMEQRLLFEMELMDRVDEITALSDEELKKVRLAKFKEQMDKYSVAPEASKHRELDWLNQLFSGSRLRNISLFKFKPLGVLKTIVFSNGERQSKSRKQAVEEASLQPVRMKNGASKETYVQSVFTSIARRYDLLNTCLSFGLHRFWKKKAVSLMNVSDGAKVLDVCSGTGDLAIELTKWVNKKGKVHAVDFCGEMIELGRKKASLMDLSEQIEFVEANAESLLFPDNFFDGVIMGFGGRNVSSLDKALSEMRRVIKPGSRAVFLEFTKPPDAFFGKLYRFYLFKLIPVIGGLISGDKEAYTYLARSIDGFYTTEGLKTLMEDVGFKEVFYLTLNARTLAIHVGTKP